MGFLKRVVLVFILTTVSAGITRAQDQRLKRAGAQTSFCADLPLDHPVTVPKNVLNLLLASREVQENLASFSEAERVNPRQLFRAARVHLSRPDQADLIVIGNAPMSGADNDWFWVVRSAYVSPKIVLFEGANCLDISLSSTRGVRNIRSLWSSASRTREVLYRFNGEVYKQSKVKWSEN